MEYVEIAAVADEVQACLLEVVLEERGIPYRLRTFRDSAFDGLFQTPTMWGRLEAPSEWREEILAIMADLEQIVPPLADEG